jgi:hypothetical protein
MAVHVLSAVRTDGRRFQFNSIPRDEQHARKLAARAAALLSLFGSPSRFGGSNVYVHDAVTRKLIASMQIPRRSARKGGIRA